MIDNDVVVVVAGVALGLIMNTYYEIWKASTQCRNTPKTMMDATAAGGFWIDVSSRPQDLFC